MFDDFISLNTLLAEYETVECKLKIDAKSFGKSNDLLSNCDYQYDELKKGAVLSLPLWLAFDLHSKNIVEVTTPKHLTKRFRANLLASPSSVSFSGRTSHFYSTGLYFAKMRRDNSILNSLQNSLASRCAILVDRAHHSAEGDLRRFVAKLDVLEESIFMRLFIDSKNYDIWRNNLNPKPSISGIKRIREI